MSTAEYENHQFSSGITDGNDQQAVAERMVADERSTSLREMVVEAYGRMVRAVHTLTGNKDMANDAAQQASVNILNTQTFNPAEVSYPARRRYTRTAAVNAAYDLSRKDATQRAEPIIEEDSEQDDGGNYTVLYDRGGRDGGYAHVDSKIDTERMLRLLERKVNNADNWNTYMLFQQGFEYAEIAAQLGVKEGTVKSRLNRIRKIGEKLCREYGMEYIGR